MSKCVRCGRTVEGLLIENLCLDCFLYTREINLTYTLEIDECTVCGRVKLGGKWLKSEKEVSEAIRARIMSDYRKAFSRYGLDIETVDVDREGFKVTITDGRERGPVSGRLSIHLRRTICPLCLRDKQEKHESVVQLRFDRSRDFAELESLARELLATLPPNMSDQIVSIEELKEGLDIKVFSHSAARSIANFIKSRYPAEVKETHKLLTIKGGERRSRLTISVRIMDSERPHVVLLKGRPALMKPSSSGKVKLLTADGILLIADRKRIEKESRPFRGRVSQVTVIGEDERLIYLVDSENRNLDIPRERAVRPMPVGSVGLLAEEEGGDRLLFPLF